MIKEIKLEKEVELTYEEHLLAKRNLIIDNYIFKIDEFIRNVKLEQEDLIEGVLSNSFFKRKDISILLKKILIKHTKNANNQLKVLK